MDANLKKELTNSVCRVCLLNEEQNYEKWFTLFEHATDRNIAAKISSIADVNIKEGDGLPDRICPDCLLQLENAVAFKSKCETSNNILNNPSVWKHRQNICELTVKLENEQYYNDTDIFDTKDPVISPDTSDVENVDIKIDDGIETNWKPLGSEVVCHDCSGTFKSKCKLRVHWRRIHQPDYLTCPSCKRIFGTYKAFNRHRKKPPMICKNVVKAKIEIKGKCRIFHCPECNYKTKESQTIQYHMLTHTGGTLKCDKCPKVFVQPVSLMYHKEAEHKEYTIEVTCEYCGLIIKGRRKIYTHLKNHQFKDKLPCKVCKKTFKNTRSLQHHMIRHSGIKAFSCGMCKESFYTSSDRANHKNKVHVKKKFPCDICGYILNNITALKRHKSKHTAVNVVCFTCGIFAENEEKLILHQKMHTERKYPCPLCEKNFYTAKSRGRHVIKKHMTTMTECNKKLSK